MEIPRTTLSFLVAICAGFKTSFYLMDPYLRAVHEGQDPKAEDLRRALLSRYAFFGTLLLLWYFLFWYLLPVLWSIFFLFSFFTSCLFIRGVVRDSDDFRPKVYSECPRIRVLRLFCENQEDEFTHSEVFYGARLQSGASVPILMTLKKEGLIKSRRSWPERQDPGPMLYSLTEAGLDYVTTLFGQDE